MNYTRTQTTPMGSPRCRVRSDSTERDSRNANQPRTARSRRATGGRRDRLHTRWRPRMRDRLGCSDRKFHWNSGVSDSGGRNSSDRLRTPPTSAVPATGNTRNVAQGVPMRTTPLAGPARAARRTLGGSRAVPWGPGSARLSALFVDRLPPHLSSVSPARRGVTLQRTIIGCITDSTDIDAYPIAVREVMRTRCTRPLLDAEWLARIAFAGRGYLERGR